MEESSARRTVYNMLQKRGYVVDVSREDFMKQTNEDFLTHKINDNTIKMYVFFSTLASVGVSTVRNYLLKMKEDNVSNAIIVVKNSITSKSKEITSEMDIDIFSIKELAKDITEHEFVPKHELLTKEQVKELVQCRGIKETQLSRCNKEDPVCKYYGAKKGQVFKITRVSETGGLNIIYKLVI